MSLTKEELKEIDNMTKLVQRRVYEDGDLYPAGPSSIIATLALKKSKEEECVNLKAVLYNKFEYCLDELRKEWYTKNNITINTMTMEEMDIKMMEDEEFEEKMNCLAENYFTEVEKGLELIRCK